jgi:hypothetical protein
VCSPAEAGKGLAVKESQRSRAGAWRLAATFLSLGLLAWGLAALAYFNATAANADSGPAFRDVDTILLVPQDGEWFYVKVGFFIYDNGDGSFAEAADTARAEMLSRFPGAIEVEESVSAAYVTSGFKWMSGSAAWGYNGAGAPAGLSGAQGAVQAGAATWGQQGVPFSFTGGGASGNGTGACGGGTDGSNTVGWGAQSGSVLAVTCSWFGSTGSPFKPAVEFDMEIDPDWNWSTGTPIQVDLQSVALHEFGHALGLNHSGDGSAVMFPSYTAGTNKRTPSADDVAGLTAIYGGGGSTPTKTPTPAGTPGGTATNTPSATPPLATSTPTRTPTPGGGGGSPTPPLPTSTPTNTPAPGGGGGAGTPTPPLATSTPVKTVTPTSPPTQGPSPTASPTPGNSLPIQPGANLLAWPGNEAPPAVALAGVPNLKVVYAYDPVSGHWTRYIPGAPGFLNNLAMLKKGGAYWFIASGSAQIPFQP